MKTFLTRINPFRGSTGRFDRYYSGIIGSGAGYPTADEARRDLRSYDQMTGYSRWSR